MGAQLFHANRCFRNSADAPNKRVFLAGSFSWYIEVYSNHVYKKNHFFKIRKLIPHRSYILLYFKYADYVFCLFSNRKTMYDIPSHGPT
jgi:hypothetical protein